MERAKQFVVRTDKLSSPQYFAGVLPGRVLGITNNVVLTPIPMEAWAFADRAEAEELIRDLQRDGDDDWFISELLGSGMSRGLKQAMAGGA